MGSTVNKSDKSAKERYEYNLKISNKEQEFDELQSERKQVVRVCELFEQTMMQGFRKLAELEGEYNRRSPNQSEFSESKQQKYYFSNMLLQHEEQLTAMYEQLSRTLENEREELQRKRDDLPWD